MTRWFRVYGDLVDDPKVQRLPDRLFKALINLWCLASERDGNLPDIETIAFKLRVKPAGAQNIVDELRAVGLLDNADGVTRPHNWSGRQFKGDVSNERVKRHRERQRNVTPSVTATPPDTDTETEATQQKAPPIEVASSRKADLDGIEEECRAAAGLENDPSPGLFDISPLVTLIDKGYSLSRDILPKLREAKAKNKKGATWRYYVPAIEQAKQANGSIRLNERDKPGPPTLWVTTDSPDWAAYCERWRREHGKDPPAFGSRNEFGQGWHFPASYRDNPISP